MPHQLPGDRKLNVSDIPTKLPRTSSTFLTHFFGQGLTESRYVVERFRAMVNGDIRRLNDGESEEGQGPRNGGRGRERRKKPVIATMNAVRDLRPAYNEIIICTGLQSRGGVQYWGCSAAGFAGERAQKG